MIYRVRPQPWGPSAIDSWTKRMFGRGLTFGGIEGCFIWFLFWPFILGWVAVKASFWLLGIIAILLTQGAVAVCDLATYRHRKTVATRATWPLSEN